MKKYIVSLLVGCALVLIGTACFYIETINYNINTKLPSYFPIAVKEMKYKIEDNQTFIVTNYGSNKNMNLYIDNTLSDEIKIVISHANILNIRNTYVVNKDGNNERISLNLYSSLDLEENSTKCLFNLGVSSLKEKTIYNHTLLKYPEIKIFVNEKYRKNIAFVDSHGKTYNPIR